jgi:hypothetical protein
MAAADFNTGERAPAQDFAEACDQTFPDAGGLFGRLYQLARRWDGGYPSWSAEWIDSERRAVSLRSWEPLLIPGTWSHPTKGRPRSCRPWSGGFGSPSTR